MTSRFAIPEYVPGAAARVRSVPLEEIAEAAHTLLEAALLSERDRFDFEPGELLAWARRCVVQAPERQAGHHDGD